MGNKTLSENVNQAISDFGAIKQAIVDKGVDVPTGTPTSQYGTKIGEIQTGGGTIPTKGFVPTAWDENGHITEGDFYGDSVAERYFYSSTSSPGANPLTEYIKKVNFKTPVLEIADYAFSSCANLSGVIFHSLLDLKTIGNSAFSGCGKLDFPQFPTEITEIGEFAFRSCKELSAPSSLPPKLKNIKRQTFYSCSKLACNQLPRELETIEVEAFYSCSKVTFSSLPETLTYIGGYAFQGCKLVTFSSLPQALTYIGGYAFRECENATFSNFPDSLTYIGTYAFRDCKNATFSTLPTNVTEILSYAFSGCSKVTFSVIPANITRIGDGSFASCSLVTFSVIPANITRIGERAFYYCKGITSMTFKGKPTIYSNTFYNCTNLTTINVPWAEGEVAGAPWGASNATITYSYVE